MIDARSFSETCQRGSDATGTDLLNAFAELKLDLAGGGPFGRPPNGLGSQRLVPT